MATLISAAIVFAIAFIVWAVIMVLLEPLLGFVITFSVQPLTIPVVSEAILYSQACALVVAVIVRIVKGVYEVGLGRGGERHESFGEWLFKSILAIAGVALMPVFCNMVVQVCSWLYADIQGGIALESITRSFATVTAEDVESVFNLSTAGLAMTFVNTVITLIAAGACVKVAYELLKRQIVMLIVSVTATWVSVKAAMDSADDYLDILVSLFGLGLTQWVQYLFLAVALSMFADMTDSGWLFMSLDSADTVKSALFTLAAFGGAMAVPAVIERYAFSTGRGGMGGMLVGMGLRGGIRGAGSLAGSVANAVTGGKPTP